MIREMVHICLRMAVSVLMLPALLTSCTGVAFSEFVPDLESTEMDDASMSAISFNVDWHPLGLDDDEVPEDMIVLMSRLQNVTLHYVWHIDSSGAIIQSLEKRSDDEPSDESGEGDVSDEVGDGDVEEEEDDAVRIYNGLYSVMAVASSNPDDFFVTNLDRFQDSLALRMRDMYVGIPEISKEEKQEQMYTDYNPLYPFIRSVEPMYFVRSEEETHHRVSSLSDNVITLSPMPMTRKITFSITADAEPGVSIDRMVGIISGVPASAQFMSGYVSRQNLCKMPFEMTKVPGSDDEYSGCANVFGLFPSDSPELITGSGILNLILHASVEQDGAVVRRMFHASINLMETITAADVMVKADDKIHYVLNGMQDLTFRIADKLVVTKEKILTGSEQGFEVWQENDTDDDPGLNRDI